MQRYFSKLYITIVIIAVLLSVLMGTVWDNTYYYRLNDNSAEDWTIVPQEKDGYYEYTLTLPEEDTEGKTIAFQTAHFELEVDIDGENVFVLKATNPEFNKSTGYRYNFIKLKAEDAGKLMTIRWISVYDDIKPKSDIYYGDEYDISRTIFKKAAAKFYLATFILIIGIVLLAYVCCIEGKKTRDAAMFHFSIFSILLACWSMMESSIFDLLGFWPVGNMVLDHYALMLMPIAFTMFFENIISEKSRKICDIYVYANTAIIFLRTLLQVTTLYDLKETLWMTQLSIAVFVLMAVILGIYEIRITKMTRRMRLNTICMILILATTLLELVLFKIFQRSNVYGMIGFTIYVVVMSIEMVKDSRKTMERAREAELYHRLAYTDALTGVYNRMAFHQDVENFQSDKESKKAYTVFMLDLNDLKKCNDNFGHENGDKYIKLVSDILVKVFGIDGRCYRIGGDEFCVFMQNADKGDINGKLSSLTRYVEEENKKGFVIRIGVAVGYAVYDEKRDKNLQDTVKRADELMYQNKANIKSKI